MLPWSRPGRGADRNMRQMSCHLPDEVGCVTEVPLPGHTVPHLLRSVAGGAARELRWCPLPGDTPLREAVEEAGYELAG
jgi:hypothetical protein